MFSLIVQLDVRGSLSLSSSPALWHFYCACVLFLKVENFWVKWKPRSSGFDVPKWKLADSENDTKRAPLSSVLEHNTKRYDRKWQPIKYCYKPNYIIPFISIDIDPSRNEQKEMVIALGFSKPIKWFALLLKFLLNNKAREKWVISL